MTKQFERPDWDPALSSGCKQGHQLIEFNGRVDFCPLCLAIEGLKAISAFQHIPGWMIAEATIHKIEKQNI